jgi:Cu/Ag efflux protein CusF
MACGVGLESCGVYRLCRLYPTGAYSGPPRTPGSSGRTAAAGVNDARLQTVGPPSARPVAAATRGRPGASSSEGRGAHTVIGEGKVIAVVPASSEIVLTHGEIKGFMEAMTMGYPILPPSLLEGVQAGDTVRFTIDTEQKAIVKLEKLKP